MFGVSTAEFLTKQVLQRRVKKQTKFNKNLSTHIVLEL